MTITTNVGDELIIQSNDVALTNIAHIVNGVIVSLTPAQFKTYCAANTVYTFTHAFSHQVGPNVVHYAQNRTYTLDATTKAILVAANAPMVLV
jgi:hypothetical protein